jgi:hypothetical protein
MAVADESYSSTYLGNKMEKTFAQKMKNIGGVAVLLSIVSFMFIAGGVEHLPPEAGIKEWTALIGASVVALTMGLFGVSLLTEE